MRPARALTITLLLSAMALAGCVSGDHDADLPAAVPTVALDAAVPVQVEGAMTFTQAIVTEAVGYAQDLYEPTMEVSDTGAIYVAAHVIGAATTGTPAYVSLDDGKSWKQMPVVASVSLPGAVQGGQPPPGDEGFFVAGEDGRVWMADIYAAGFSVTGWCDDGGSQCYDNRQAYDRIKATSEFCADGTDPNASTAASLNDRPWAAYAPGVGKLLLVNNPGGGPMQLGMLQVPPATPVGFMDPVTAPTWNLCASPSGWIPGVPAMRADGFFAVPQIDGGGDDQYLNVVTGNVADIFTTQLTKAFDVTSSYGGTSNGGRTAFDGTGALFVGAYNNTKPTDQEYGDGQFVIAVSQDDGVTFRNATFATGSPVRSFYLDSHLSGPGALVTWSQLSNDTSRSDWYVAHVHVGADGLPELRHVTRAVTDGPHSSAHVMGASVGPDGRAYFVNFDDTSDPTQYALSNPLSVWVQQDGPVLEPSPA